MTAAKPSPPRLGALKAAKAEAQAFRRILRRLMQPGAVLAPLDGGQENSAFGLFVAKNEHARAVMTLDASMLGALRAAGLIAAVADRPGAYAAVPEAEAYLQRAMAAADPFEAQHRAMGARFIPGDAHEAAAGALRAVNLAESPLAWLASRKGPDGAPLLERAHVDAGERLREDYERAQLMASLTVNWERPMARGAQAPESLTLSEAAMAARQRVGAALAAVGPELETVLIAVCCHLQGLEAAERQLRWPPRAGKVVLRIALESLARHYGLIRTRTKAEMRAWSA
jgi:hypothetical protein